VANLHGALADCDVASSSESLVDILDEPVLRLDFAWLAGCVYLVLDEPFEGFDMITPILIARVEDLAENINHDHVNAPMWSAVLDLLIAVAKSQQRTELSLAELRAMLLLPEPPTLHYEADSLPAILRKQAQ
jgi:hypothetical protein